MTAVKTDLDSKKEFPTDTVASKSTSILAQPDTSSTLVAPVLIRKKYEMCKNFREKGACRYGDKCLFAHGEHELTRRETVPDLTT